MRITSDQPCLDSELFCTQIVSDSTTFIINIFSRKGIYFCLFNIYNIHDYKYKAGLYNLVNVSFVGLFLREFGMINRVNNFVKLIKWYLFHNLSTWNLIFIYPLICLVRLFNDLWIDWGHIFFLLENPGREGLLCVPSREFSRKRETPHIAIFAQYRPQCVNSFFCVVLGRESSENYSILGRTYKTTINDKP